MVVLKSSEGPKCEEIIILEFPDYDAGRPGITVRSIKPHVHRFQGGDYRCILTEGVAPNDRRFGGSQ